MSNRNRARLLKLESHNPRLVYPNFAEMYELHIRSDFIVRMRSIGKTRKEIERLDFYLSVSMDNVNDLAKNSANIKKLRPQHPEFKAEQ